MNGWDQTSQYKKLVFISLIMIILTMSCISIYMLSILPVFPNDIEHFSNESSKCKDWLHSFGIYNDKEIENTTYVMILGSGGLIGSKLKDDLIHKGYRVIHVLSRHHLDLRIKGSLDIFNNYRIEFVYFLAYEVGGSKYLQGSENQDFILKSNTMMMDNVFEWIERQNIRFAFSSSSLSAENSSYGISKMKGELFTRNKHNLGRVFRLWNVYGFEYPGPKSHVIPDILYQCFTKGKASFLTDGSELRQFMHVDDVSSSLIAIMEHFDETEPIVDLSDGVWISLKELGTAIQSVLPFCSLKFSERKAKHQNRHNPKLSTLWHSKYFQNTTNIIEGIMKTSAMISEFIEKSKKPSITIIISVPNLNSSYISKADSIVDYISSKTLSFRPLSIDSIVLAEKVYNDFAPFRVYVSKSVHSLISQVSSDVVLVISSLQKPPMSHFDFFQRGLSQDGFYYVSNDFSGVSSSYLSQTSPNKTYVVATKSTWLSNLKSYKVVQFQDPAI